MTRGAVRAASHAAKIGAYMNTVPLSAIFEGDAVVLRGDVMADPCGDDPRFENPLHVHKAYSGRPNNEDMHITRGYDYVAAGSSNDKQDDGMTLLVAGADCRGMVIYFPDDQHEVAVAPARDDAENDD